MATHEMGVRRDVETLFDSAKRTQEIAIEILDVSDKFMRKARESGQPVSPELDQYLNTVASLVNRIEKKSRESQTLIGS